MQVIQTPRFKKQVKKLHKNQKKQLDAAVLVIMENPEIGQLNKGDLDAIRVYKFKMVKQLTLVAYEFFDDELQLVLLAMASHENFYHDLKS